MASVPQERQVAAMSNEARAVKAYFSDDNFEQLLSDLSASFVRVPVEEIDNEIERWLQRIVLAMNVDRSTVVQVDPADNGLYTTHQWAREGVSTPDRGKREEGSASNPWLARRVMAGEITVIPRIDEMPPEAAKDQEEFRRSGNKSNVTLPLRTAGVVTGALLFGAILAEKAWSPEEVQRLRLIADIFGNALERKRSEAEIRRLSEELRKVSQIVSMGELTAALAHELNQPLAAILSNANALRRMLAAKADALEIDGAVEDIIRDDARAVEIVRDVRGLFKRGQAKKSPVDIKELLLEVTRIVGADAKARGISIKVDLPDSFPPVPGDKTHLTQGILNLVFNAFDSVSESDGPREVVLRATCASSDRIQVSIRDTGGGIEDKLMPRLFEPFFTTKPTGMGMGLAIVRSIVESHGGRIWATQNPDRGATLQFELPVESAAAVKIRQSRTSRSN